MGLESPRINASVSGTTVATAIVADDLEIGSGTLSIDETNNLVGIGTTSPATALHIKSSTGNTAIKVQAGSAADDDGAAQVTFSDWQRTASIGVMSTDIVIAKDSSIDPLSDNRRVTLDIDNGNFGIGHKFGQHRRPEGSASASVLTVENTTTSGSAQGGNIRLGSNDDAPMESGHRLGVIEFAGSEAASPGPAGSAMAVGARIEAVTDSVWSTTENGTNLDFYTTDGDAVQTKQMTISATGDVGIGPTAPVKNLHVSKSSGESTFRLQSAGYYSDFIQNGANLFIQNAAGGGNIIIYDDSAERLRIDTNGKVTIPGEVSLGGATSFDSAVADENVSGITATFTAGEALSRGECVYFKAGDSKMWKAVATAAATSRCVALAAADIAADATGLFLLQGFLRDDGTYPAYNAGVVLYTPEAESSGENVPEEAAPDTSGDFVQVIGWSVTANIIYFQPDSTVIEVA